MLTTAVGFFRISGICEFIRPPTSLATFFWAAADSPGKLLALLTAADGTFSLVFDTLDFSSLLVLTNLPPYPLIRDDFPFTGTTFPFPGDGGEGLSLLSLVECVLFSLLLLLCLSCSLPLCLLPNCTKVVAGLGRLATKFRSPPTSTSSPSLLSFCGRLLSSSSS